MLSTGVARTHRVRRQLAALPAASPPEQRAGLRTGNCKEVGSGAEAKKAGEPVLTVALMLSGPSKVARCFLSFASLPPITEIASKEPEV